MEGILSGGMGYGVRFLQRMGLRTMLFGLELFFGQ
jgi:hypothetical protein